VIRKLDKPYGNGRQYFDAVETEASGQANIRQRSGPASMSLCPNRWTTFSNARRGSAPRWPSSYGR
jgi:hypothetical protein